MIQLCDPLPTAEYKGEQSKFVPFSPTILNITCNNLAINCELNVEYKFHVTYMGVFFMVALMLSTVYFLSIYLPCILFVLLAMAWCMVCVLHACFAISGGMLLIVGLYHLSPPEMGLGVSCIACAQFVASYLPPASEELIQLWEKAIEHSQFSIFDYVSM